MIIGFYHKNFSLTTVMTNCNELIWVLVSGQTSMPYGEGLFVFGFGLLFCRIRIAYLAVFHTEANRKEIFGTALIDVRLLYDVES